MTEGDRMALLEWFDRNKRDLPWRRTRDPYAIWVSEIMLQQTQVATVVPYWHRWLERFPTVEALALADEQEVLSLWQGLGYYRRGRMLLAGARWICENGLPLSAKDWLAVPGVGRYTAGAVASIAFGEPTPVVDGNVERVFARCTACAESGSKLTSAAWSWATESLNRMRPGDWNQALMELGATVCRPSSPSCPQCPLEASCKARQRGIVEELPRKSVKPKLIDLEFHVVVPISASGRFGVRQIPSGQWWAGMWEFPREVSPAELPWQGRSLGMVKHQVTHHRLRLHAAMCREVEEIEELDWLEADAMGSLPMPAAQRRIWRMANGE